MRVQFVVRYQNFSVNGCFDSNKRQPKFRKKQVPIQGSKTSKCKVLLSNLNSRSSLGVQLK